MKSVLTVIIIPKWNKKRFRASTTITFSMNRLKEMRIDAARPLTLA